MPHQPNQHHEPDPDPGREPLGATLRGRWERRSARARALTVAATVVALAAGGTVAYAATSTTTGTGTGAVPAAAASPSGSPSHGGPDRDGHGHDHGHGPGSWSGFAMGGDAVHGEATVKDRKTGKFVVRTWQRGTVRQVTGDQVTVRSDDGARWTWTVGSGVSVRREDGSSASGAGALAKGDTVLLVGTRSGDTRTATFALDGAFTGKRPGGGGPWPGVSP